ncbi:hypothetical protein C8R46DRAFT_1043520 [Mycena filopes]|nr:hypothetical protein C8R46DRAFT_1043520 [Mycena filopes]
MQLSLFALIALAIAAPVHSSVFARVEGQIPDIAPAKWLSIEESISYDNTSLTLAPRVGAEFVACFNSGTRADRAPIISVIDDWCGKVIGTTVTNGQTLSARYSFPAFTVFVSAKAINGCNFVIDGNCNRLLRLPVDKCDTSGENSKRGGVETDSCGQWTTDPGCCGTDV